VSACRIRYRDNNHSRQCNNSNECHDDCSLVRERPTRNC
jgi:hypothetical protein